MKNFSVSGNLVDIFTGTVYPATVRVEDGLIAEIQRDENSSYSDYILPGFIDAHVHIESSLLVPDEFARMAVVHGTVACVSDPHEIANVLGIDGVRFMIGNAARTPFEIAFGVPSCVPATPFETAGAVIGLKEIEELFKEDGLSYLSEMMNFPGVLSGDKQVVEKIKIAAEGGYPVDGHAPGLLGEDARRYIDAGISTDHECLGPEEVRDKLEAGMKILIREGSAAKSFGDMHSFIDTHTEQCMFCSDDKHPDELERGHINDLVKESVALGHDVMKVLKVACMNPVLHYNLNVGLLRKSDPADFIVVDNLRDFTVKQTFCKGVAAAENGKTLLPRQNVEPVNIFNASPVKPEDFIIAAEGSDVRVIEAFDGQLFTAEQKMSAPVKDGAIVSDTERDILKIAVVNRYEDTAPALALIKNFGLKHGAIASSVAHDSHNIVAVGTSDQDICAAVNAIIQHRGGLAAAYKETIEVLPLPVAGLMTTEDGWQTSGKYARLDSFAKELGSSLSAPFMTLSFMALLVIPELKLSDKGLFSGRTFDYVSLFL